MFTKIVLSRNHSKYSIQEGRSAMLNIDLLPDGVPLTRALADLWDSKNHGVFLAVRAQRKADAS